MGLVAMVTTHPLPCVLVYVCVAVCLFTIELDLYEDRKVITTIIIVQCLNSEPQLIQGT